MYPPAVTTIVFAGIPIGVAYAHEPPMTHAINTALGSAPIPCAIDIQIGTISAVVAVLDMKFVITQHSIKITNVSTYGDGLFQASDYFICNQFSCSCLLKCSC